MVQNWLQACQSSIPNRKTKPVILWIFRFELQQRTPIIPLFNISQVQHTTPFNTFVHHLHGEWLSCDPTAQETMVIFILNNLYEGNMLEWSKNKTLYYFNHTTHISLFCASLVLSHYVFFFYYDRLHCNLIPES